VHNILLRNSSEIIEQSGEYAKLPAHDAARADHERKMDDPSSTISSIDAASSMTELAQWTSSAFIPTGITSAPVDRCF